MELKEDVWYVIDTESHRASFIIALSKATKLTERDLRAKCDNLYTAKVFKWKTKSIDPFIIDINYRSEFKPDYLRGKIEHFSPVPTVELRPIDLASYKDISILSSDVIKEWVDARIADIERNKAELTPTGFTINTACGQSGLSNHVDSWLETTKKLMINKQQNTMTKIYGGENNMICSNECNEKYLIQQYFEKEEKKLANERNQAENDLLKNTALYKAAEAFILEANANKGYKCAPTARCLIKDYLTPAQLNALNELNTKYNEEVEKVHLYCKQVESLINMCDNADQKMDILRRYEIIKLPKMPK